MCVEQRISAVMDALGMTQSGFAELVGITQPQVSQLLSGKRAPSLEMLSRVLSATGASGHYLITGSGPMFAARPEAEIEAYREIERIVLSAMPSERVERALDSLRKSGRLPGDTDRETGPKNEAAGGRGRGTI